MTRVFEVVPDTERGDARGGGKTLAWLSLLDGKTIRIPLNSGTGNWSRQAKTNGKVLRSHRTPAGIVLWLEDRA